MMIQAVEIFTKADHHLKPMDLCHNLFDGPVSILLAEDIFNKLE